MQQGTTKIVQFNIPLSKNPIPYQNNMRSTNRGVHFKTKKLTEYQNIIWLAAKMQMQIQVGKQTPFEADYENTFSLYLHFRLKGKTHGDLDNMAKSVIDSLQGVLFTNDKFCSKLSLSYEYDESPSIDVTFFPN